MSTEQSEKKSKVVAVEFPIDFLVEHPDNPRTASWDLGELVNSIRQHGIMTPIIVRPLATKGGGPRFQILAGHRRVRAAVDLGLDMVPCRVVEVADSETWTVLLGENIQRQNLNVLEEGRAFKALRARGLTVLAIANRLGCSEQRVSRRIALTELSPQEQEAVLRKEITIEDAWKLVAKLRGENRKGPKIGEGTGRHSKWHEHFNTRHPLHAEAGKICDEAKHPVPSRLGPACGRCWEEAIRDDQHNTTWWELEIDDDPAPPREKKAS